MKEPTRSKPGLIVIRASSVSSWADCELRMAGHSMPWAFAEHGLEMAPQRGNIGALMGSGLHGGGEAGLGEKLLSGTLPPLSVVQDAAIEEFNRRRTEERQATVEIVYSAEAPDTDTAEWQVRRLTRQFYQDVIEVAEPLMVEARLEATFRQGQGTAADPEILLSGQADLLHVDRLNGARVLRDRNAATHAGQLGSYSNLIRSYGQEVDAALIDTVRVVKPEKAQPPVDPQPLDVLAAERVATSALSEIADKAVKFIKTGDPFVYKANPSSFLCNVKFCRLYGQQACWATRGK
jgi:hypothetical protein